jgi:hypothetical protein
MRGRGFPPKSWKRPRAPGTIFARPVCRDGVCGCASRPPLANAQYGSGDPDRNELRTLPPRMTTDPLRDPDGPIPLTLANELSDLSARDIELAVTRVCSAYGTVVKVMVHLSFAHMPSRAFALVDMSLPEEAERVAVAFNRHTMGTAVLLLLPPRPAP